MIHLLKRCRDRPELFNKGPRKIQGKQALRSPAACLGHHSPATLQMGKAGWSRHQPASKVAVPADNHGGDAAAENYPSELSDALSVRK